MCTPGSSGSGHRGLRARGRGDLSSAQLGGGGGHTGDWEAAAALLLVAVAAALALLAWVLGGPCSLSRFRRWPRVVVGVVLAAFVVLGTAVLAKVLGPLMAVARLVAVA